MGFSAQWLDQREPADLAAREPALLAHAARHAGARPVVVDMASGTGSTVRAMAGALGQDATWRLVDHDADLLEQAMARCAGAVSAHRLDLNDLAQLPLKGATLLTASALLDLCARPWVQALAALLLHHRLPFYAALSYNGCMSWEPVDEADQAVTEAFNRHQQGDKGFGPALGPDAARVTAAIFRACGYQVTLAGSPWRLGPEQSDLQHDFLQGVAEAATEAGEPAAVGWVQRRRARIPAAISTIGHLDLLALPPQPGDTAP